jgi:predicted O-methyltransferase YrrM
MKLFYEKLTRVYCFGSLALFLYRIKLIVSHFFNLIPGALRWLKNSREITNFTYNLTPYNVEYLIAFIANITEIPFDTIKNYAGEALQDHQLAAHVMKFTSLHENYYMADSDLKWGRQLAYYIFVRALKPKIVVETGVDKGLGAIVVAAALMRNKNEGYDGHYFGTDINPKAGYLFTGPYATYGEILVGDSVESLKKLNFPINLFIFDSMRTSQYEALEYQTIKDKLETGSIILTTFAHGSDELLKFSLETHRRYLSFRERPLNHYYPGGEIGAAFE